MTTKQVPVRISSELNKLSQSRLNKSINTIEESLSNYDTKTQDIRVALFNPLKLQNDIPESKQTIIGYYNGYPIIIGELLDDGTVQYDKRILNEEGKPIAVWCWQNYIINEDVIRGTYRGDKNNAL